MAENIPKAASPAPLKTTISPATSPAANEEQVDVVDIDDTPEVNISPDRTIASESPKTPPPEQVMS